MVVSGQPLGQMNLADPFIYLEGDTYYAFGTESNDGFRKGKAKSGFVLHREEAAADVYHIA